MTIATDQMKISVPNSAMMHESINRLIPGGVNSPFRSFHEVGGHALFIEHGEGSRVWDVDGNTYIDYVGAWGPAILGHAPPAVVEACVEAVRKGAVFGTPHRLELEFAEKLAATVPSIEQIRFVNSGTEAVMSAIRLARGFTGRDKIVMFEGCYHGHSDSTLATSAHASSAGVPADFARNAMLVEFNNLDSLERCLQEEKGNIAAVIIEPVAGSMGLVAPKPGYLAGVRELCSQFEVVLIFDEVLTGFRVAYGGAQVLYNVIPDLTCFGKALGGGMPIGAYGGKTEIMERLSPNGDVYQAGTFSGNPVTMAGGIATLEGLSRPGVYDVLERQTKRLFDGLESALEEVATKHKKLPVQLQRVGSMFGILFADSPVENFKQSQSIDQNLFATFFHELLSLGVMLPPTAVDAACVSAAHSDEDIDSTVSSCLEAFCRIATPK